MSRGKYAPEFKTKLVLEVLRGERELGAIAAEHNLNPNMLRNWKAEFLAHASSVFEEPGKSEREAKRKEAAVKKERDKMLKTYTDTAHLAKDGYANPRCGHMLSCSAH